MSVNLAVDTAHVAQGELVEPLGAEAGQDVQPRERLVGRAGQRCIIRRDNHLAKPVSLGAARPGAAWQAGFGLVRLGLLIPHPSPAGSAVKGHIFAHQSKKRVVTI